ASLDVKDVFFQVPIYPEDQKYFTFTWDGVQCTFTRLPQGYKHSPTLVHHALVHELGNIPEIKNNSKIKLYQYINDVLIGGQSEEKVKVVYDAIMRYLADIQIETPEEKRQSPSQEAKFLGIMWKRGTWNIPPDTLFHLNQIKVPSNKKELQGIGNLTILETLQYWRKHIPDFCVIARPLYDLLKKNRHWELDTSHDEA
ncbi:hypothetical protein N331_02024, partial [Merops nubicus]